MSIWRVEWNGKDWKNPSPLGNEINTVQQEKEEWPSSNENFIFTNDGANFLYTTMLRGAKTIEIYQTVIKGNSFSTPVKIDSIFKNENLWKSSAVISPDGNYLLFNSYGAVQDFHLMESIFSSEENLEKILKQTVLGTFIMWKPNTCTLKHCSTIKSF